MSRTTTTKEVKAATNLDELVEMLNEATAEVLRGELSTDVANAVSRAAGKIINAKRTQIEYRKLRKSTAPLKGITDDDEE